MGRPKQLVLSEGKSLLRRAVEAAIGSGAAPVMVVLGRDVSALSRELAGLAAFPVVNSAWQEGMGSSLRCGVQALSREAPAVTAVLLMVCDQPRIGAAHLEGLWVRYGATGRVVAVRHGNRPGVPAIFPAKYLSELAKITGDKGARSLLEALAEAEIELVELPEASFDVDTREDLARLAADE